MEITRKDLSVVFRISDFDIEDTSPYSYSVVEKKDPFLKFLRSYGPNQKTYSLKEINKISYRKSIRLIDVLGLIDIRDRIYLNLLTNCPISLLFYPKIIHLTLFSSLIHLPCKKL